MSTPECRGPDGTCQCVASDLMQRLGTKYAMDVLCVIESHEPVRFTNLEAHVPEASTSTLSARLDDLEAAGLIVRERYDEVPPRVEYRLAEDGHELGELLRPLFDWVAEREDVGGSGPGQPSGDTGRSGSDAGQSTDRGSPGSR